MFSRNHNETNQGAHTDQSHESQVSGLHEPPNQRDTALPHDSLSPVAVPHGRSVRRRRVPTIWMTVPIAKKRIDQTTRTLIIASGCNAMERQTKHVTAQIIDREGSECHYWPGT